MNEFGIRENQYDLQPKVEEALMGVTLRNYTTREVLEDHPTHVLVTKHTEKLEKLPQPPTPEELKAQKRAEKIAAGVLITIVGGFLGLVGYAVYKDEQSMRRTTENDA